MPPKTSLLRRAARDPVVRFLTIGGLIFAVHTLLDRDPTDEPIVVSTRFVEGLRAEHRERFGREPSPSETEQLVHRFVREEALVREARKVGLERRDPIVRRRLAQKMELALRGRLEVARPTRAEIERWIETNPDEVAQDERFSFRHAFASRELRHDAARSDADAWAAAARASSDPATTVGTLGDAFVLGPTITQMNGANLADRFGEGFREAIGACPVRSVCGPLESRFGFHVVVVTDRSASGTLPFEIARPIAERAILRAREDAALDRAIDALVEEHGVVRVRERSSR